MTVRLERDTGLAYHTRQMTNRLDSAIGTAVIVDEEALSPDVVMVLQVIRKDGCLIPGRNDDGKDRTDKPSPLAVQYRADRPAEPVMHGPASRFRRRPLQYPFSSHWYS